MTLILTASLALLVPQLHPPAVLKVMPVTSSEFQSFDQPACSRQHMSSHNEIGQGNEPIVTSENELVCQHRDAGQVIPELPPPYILPVMHQS